MKLTPTMTRVILHWGEMGAKWGVNRTVAQIHALLYLAGTAMAADEIAETLDVARSNVSTSLKELQAWGLVKVSHVLGDRREQFSTSQDVWSLFKTILDERKRREFDPTVELLRSCLAAAEGDKDTSAAVRQRIEQIHEFMLQVSRWYDDVRTIPQGPLLQLMRLGAKVVRTLTRTG